MNDKKDAGPRPYRQSMLGRLAAPIRNAWRVLTSMRTALILLFLLAIDAIPGAMLPQRQLNEGNVLDYIAANGWLGELFDSLQLFDVFSSWWFTAIYVLLMLSLIGCLGPRTFDLIRQLRKPIPLAPRNLTRLSHHATLATDLDKDAAADRIEKELKGWRRTRRNGDGRVPGAIEFSSERGYLREIGNIVFHFSLLALLLSFALGRLVYYEGMRVVHAYEDSPALCTTTVTAFDSFRAGNLVDGTDIHPLCINVNNFRADYLPTGQVEMFSSDITYSPEVTTTDPQTWEPYDLRVNHPLRLDGVRVYLQGHGYAPTFTVEFPNGETRTDTAHWVPEELETFLSSGIMRFDPPAGMYPDLMERRENQIAIQGLFAPTAQFEGTILSSSFPEMRDPAVAVDVYQGDAGLDTGRSQSVFTLEQDLIDSGMLEREARVNLHPGESTQLADGTIVTFDGAEQFANLQISYDPTQIWVGASAVVMIIGLTLSLVITRRRVWVRITDTAGAGAVIDIGGLARTDRSNWGTEFDRLRDRVFEWGGGDADPAGSAVGTNGSSGRGDQHDETAPPLAGPPPEGDNDSGVDGDADSPGKDHRG